MPEPTNQGGEGRAQHQSDEAGTINIPQDQVHPDLANAPHPNQTQTYPVNINGRIENWTLEKLTAEAQTGVAGREAFQQAAEQRKENAKALASQEDLELVFKDNDVDAFRRLGAAHGVPGDQVEAIAKRTFGDPSEGGDEDEDEKVVNTYLKEDAARREAGQTRSRSDSPVDYDKLTPDLQRIMRGAEKVRIDEIVQIALDKDEQLAYNISGQTPEGRKAIHDMVDEKIRGRLPEFGGDFGDGVRILAEVLPEVKTHLQALGTPGQRTRTGLGHAPGGGDTEVYPTKKPDHVPSSEGEAFEQHILEDLQYNQELAERGKR